MHVRDALRQLRRRLLHAAVRRPPPLLRQAMRRPAGLRRPLRRLRRLHALARHTLHQARRRGRWGSCACGTRRASVGGGVHLQRRAAAAPQRGARGPGHFRRRSPVRQLRHHLHPALAERPTRTKVAVQRVRNPLQEGGAARGRRRGGADGDVIRQRHGIRVRVRAAAASAAAAAVGLLQPGRGQGGVLHDVRRSGAGGRAVPAVGARRHALLAGFRLRPGDDQPLPLLLASSYYSR